MRQRDLVRLGGLALLLAPALSHGSCRHRSAYSQRAPLFGQRAVLRLLVPLQVSEERVHRAASLAFREAGLVETRDRTGILIYVSLLEHRVVVLADRGIDSRVEPGTWDAVVARIVTGIKADRAEEGLADGIRLCGEILASRFPPRPDDTNEIPNAPRGA